ncbi:MAG: MOSC N-terminal beta barrel domain-containing protein [Methylibium sp.]|uniref:MOSC domain-containing protein n=1 Tax=Methylibium sp. TaxID=2067992 RepID=UPI0017D7A8DB|nr:MOSC N-terminal beta barrel domain-containing protein [Methylibium sp.]MBA3591570.1 MOSC N-terminal beta barrel domain-containing protein [Methylibium sp.]MBA3625520.1 MOSC N-terminal beta barrel domain-containing protein [Methylibium sp.]
MSESNVTIAGLHVYPVKSCAGVDLDEVLLIETGLEFDRAWMLVDDQGESVSQRELPRLALVHCDLRHSELVLRAPGMLALHLALDTVDAAVRVRIWNDDVAAYDMGALAAQWFSDFLRQPLRLVRFDPEQKRLASRAWTGAIEAEAAFSDEFPLLVLSQASLDALNERLAYRDVAPVTMQRFRPNVVLTGLDAHGEDFLDEITFDTPEGAVRLKLVKPCTRCPIPNVDPQTGEPGTEPGDTLATYRSDPRVGGAVTLGMNAVIVEGIERALRVGQIGRTSLRF